MGPRHAVALAFLASTLCCGGGTPSAPSPSPTPPRDIEALLRDMTLDEKVGQMAQADRSYLRSEADIRGTFLGSLLSGGGSSPAPTRRRSAGGSTGRPMRGAGGAAPLGLFHSDSPC